MKILTVGAEMFRAEGQAGRHTDGRCKRQRDMTQLIGAFLSFTNAF